MPLTPCVIAAQLNPLYQLVELVRGAAFGFDQVSARAAELALAPFEPNAAPLPERHLNPR